jgi:hypothetical protein
MKEYLYAISRLDLPKEQVSVQATHAALEHTYLYGKPKSGHPSYIHLTTKDKVGLAVLKVKLAAAGIATSCFYEPHRDWGLTAIACCLTEEQRHHLSNLNLWRI